MIPCITVVTLITFTVHGQHKMTLFHFGNCVALAFAPYFISYKYSGL